MKRVLVFITDMALGGRQTFCLTLVNELIRQGVDCSMYISYGGGANLGWIDRHIETYISDRAVSKSMLRLVRFVRKYPESPCFVLSTEMTIVLCLLKRLGLIRNPIYHRESMEAGKFDFKWRMLVRFFFPVLSGMVVTSDEMGKEFSRIYRVKHPVTMVRNPCRFSERPESQIDVPLQSDLLLSVARLHPQKGHDRLLRSFARFGEGYQLELWGEGELEQTIKSQVDGLGIGGRVCFCGHSHDVASVYRSGGILVFASYYEGLPNALIEGIVCGCRAVVPDCLPGTVELMNELGVGDAVVRGDFESNLFPTIERVNAQSAEVWETARQKLIELTRTEDAVKRIAAFIGVE